MKPEVLLEQLEQAADRLGIRVSYEQLQSSVVTGGLCKVKGAYRIIIDKRASSEERLSTLAAALAAFPPGNPGGWIDASEVSPKLRELLRLHEPSSKHRRTAA
ncbi:MAG TPA: hypothetical protein VN253_17890 [Kofleriaceae bacterium]|nr:hypothetical protein [Kofleriaceae bacterium]